MPLIQGKQIADSAINTARLADAAVTEGKIAASALSATGGLMGGGGTTLSVKADVTGGANLAKVLNLSGNGLAIKIDSSTIEENGTSQLGVKDLGIGTAKLAAAAVTPAKAALSTGNTWTFADPIGVGTPTADGHATTKAYVDALAQGIDVRASVRVATAAALPANTRTGNVLTASANGALPAIDGVTLVLNDRLLVKNEVTGANNGLYYVSQVGDVGNPWTLTRTADADASAEVTAGMFCFVTEGTSNADSGWVLSTNDPITLNTTALAFAQFSGAGQVTAGAGLTKTGNTLDVGAGSGVQVNADSVEVIYGLVGELDDIQPNDTVSAGVTNKAARVDHRHAIMTAVPGAFAAAAAGGSATSFARSDHAHPINITAVEDITTELVTGDVALADKIVYDPLATSVVSLFLNGILCEQGANKDYTLGGNGSRTITWLAGTGSAPDLATTDKLTVAYAHAASTTP